MGRLERIVGCEGRQMMEVAVEGLGGHRPALALPLIMMEPLEGFEPGDIYLTF